MTTPGLVHELLDRAAATHPERPAVTDGEQVFSYRELSDRSRRLAGWLCERGVRRGDRVVVAPPSDVLVPALLYACSRVGAGFAVIRPGGPEVALAHVLDDAEPALLVADQPAAGELARRRGVRQHGFEELRAAAEAAAAVPSDPPLPVDPVCFIYTSGSTGMPKAVVSTHAQVTFAALAIQSQLVYLPDDTVFCPLPLSFDYGLYQIFLCTIAGARLWLGTAEQAGHRLLPRLCESGATVLPAVPSLAANLARLLDRPGAATPPLRLLTNTGAAMPPPVLAALRARLPDLQVQLMFGLTECKRVTIMPKDEDLRRPGACGRALPGTEVFALDEDGGRLPPGQVGELVVRGPHVMLGYWRRPALTSQRFRYVHGLLPQLHTGDYGWLDEDGYLYFAGRRDDLYKERGMRVSATEVEAAAHRVAGVEAAGVVPPANGRDVATLVVAGRLEPHQVLDELRGQLDEVKVPARCLVLKSLPLNGNGKLDRSGLARLAAGAGDG